MHRFRALLPLPTTKEYIPLFEAVDLEDYIVSIDCWFPYDIPIPDANTYAMVNSTFALRVLENSNTTLRICASSITSYVILLHFIYSSCLCSDLFSVSLPGRADVATLYQRGTIHTTIRLLSNKDNSSTGSTLLHYFACPRTTEFQDLKYAEFYATYLLGKYTEFLPPN